METADASAASRPDLAEALRNFSPTEEHQEAGAVVLWKDRTVEIDGDGMTVETDHIAVLVLDDQSASDYAEIALWYNSFYTEMILDEARLVLPDGKVKSVSKDAVQVRTPPDRKLFTDMRGLTFAFPTLVPGAAVEFRASRSQIKPVVEGLWTHFSLFNFIHWGEVGERPRVDPTRSAR